MSEAFECLREKLISAHIIVSPDWLMLFEVMCNASRVTLGVVVGKSVKI